MNNTIQTPEERAKQIYQTVLGSTFWGEVITPEVHQKAIQQASTIVAEIIKAGIAFQCDELVTFYDQVGLEVPRIVNPNIKH